MASKNGPVLHEGDSEHEPCPNCGSEDWVEQPGWKVRRSAVSAAQVGDCWLITRSSS